MHTDGCTVYVAITAINILNNINADKNNLLVYIIACCDIARPYQCITTPATLGQIPYLRKSINFPHICNSSTITTEIIKVPFYPELT